MVIILGTVSVLYDARPRKILRYCGAEVSGEDIELNLWMNEGKGSKKMSKTPLFVCCYKKCKLLRNTYCGTAVQGKRD